MTVVDGLLSSLAGSEDRQRRGPLSCPDAASFGGWDSATPPRVLRRRQLASTCRRSALGSESGCDEALAAALGMANGPEHFRADLLTCLGLEAATADEFRRATQRLGRELLTFLREHAPNVDPQPEIARYLEDGTLERQLGRLMAAS